RVCRRLVGSLMSAVVARHVNLCFTVAADLSHLPSFPTRRSSDLNLDHELEELKDKEATYTTDFVAGKITDKVISTVAELGKFPLLHELELDYVEYNDGKRELTNDMTVKEGQIAAGRLGMEFGVTETKDQRGKGAEISDIQMIPTETTFQMLDRWEKAKEVYP